MFKTSSGSGLSRRSALSAAVLWMLDATSSHAQTPGMTMPMEIGRVAFQNSCAKRAQVDLNQGVAAIYSFWFPQARRGFERVLQQEPQCAIAYWGVAMSDYEQIEGPNLPQGDQLQAGLDALAKARAATQKSPREQAYIDALTPIYDTASDHDTRVRRFSEAMGGVFKAYPDDPQAGVIYAMSLLKDGMPDDPDLVLARKSVTILNKVLKTEPDNPGVIHFIIHATDNPRMAAYGLDAARRYAKVAPAAPHALHMPGHIFARLGLWREDIASNIASKAAAEQPALLHTEAQNRLHAMEFLQYAYLQIGRDDLARAITQEAATIKRTDFSAGFERYRDNMEAGLRARLAIETRDWAAAAALEPASGDDGPAQRTAYWAQSVGAGHLKDGKAAQQALGRFRATMTPAQLAAAEAHPSSSFAEVQAWSLFAGGDTDGAVALLAPIADLQDRLGKGEVELPAREMLGDMLRLASRPAEALDAYATSLKTDPGRFNTLLHAGETAQTLGRSDQASGYYRLLLKNAVEPGPISRLALAPVKKRVSEHATP